MASLQPTTPEPAPTHSGSKLLRTRKRPRRRSETTISDPSRTGDTFTAKLRDRPRIDSVDVASRILNFAAARDMYYVDLPVGGRNRLSRASALRSLSRLWSTAFGQFLELDIVPKAIVPWLVSWTATNATKPTWVPLSKTELLLVLLHLDDGITEQFSQVFLLSLRLNEDLKPRALLEGKLVPARCLEAVQRLDIEHASDVSAAQLSRVLRCVPNTTSLLLGCGRVSTLRAVVVLKKLTSLSLTGRFSSLPYAIGELTQLTSLSIEASGHLTRLPDWVWSLTQLTSLDLTGNQLATLPTAITALGQLTSLNLSTNDLKELPPSIGALPHLTSLDLSNYNYGPWGHRFLFPDFIGAMANQGWGRYEVPRP